MIPLPKASAAAIQGNAERNEPSGSRRSAKNHATNAPTVISENATTRKRSAPGSSGVA